MKLYFAGLIASAVLGLTFASCGWEKPSRPWYGYERDDDACGDGRDNDRNGLVDCDDPDCMVYSTLCGPNIPLVNRDPEPERVIRLPSGRASILMCLDGIDNDDNGSSDCGERKCQSTPETCCTFEFNDARCSDGVDNDRTGFFDCGENACRLGMFVTVCEERENGVGEQTGLNFCTDMLDNDQDGRIDCTDSDCAADPTCIEAVCDNGEDDNGNGLTDCDDPGCAGRPPCASPENTIEACSDGVDNDGNGYEDCNDFSCSSRGPPDVVAFCADRAETSLEKCSDGVDNDGNGYVDCADFSCSAGTNPDVLSYCEQISETSLEKCSDGADNDGNGFTDCNDFSCSTSTDMAVITYCDSVLERGFERCSDGVDNDGNGFVDCEDFSCRNARDLATKQACQESLVALFSERAPITEAHIVQINERCSDGVDNDLDGFFDCDDWDCSWHPLVTVCEGRRVCE